MAALTPAPAGRSWPVVAAAAVPGLVALFLFVVSLHEWWLIDSHQIAVIPTPHRGQATAVELPASSLLPMILGSGVLAATFAYAAWHGSRKALLGGYLALLLVVGQAVVRRAHAAGFPEYPGRVADWVAVPDYRKRLDAANHSPYTWLVAQRDGRITARLDEPGTGRSIELPFTPAAGGHSRVADAIQVGDGWLVAFNDGEFGAGLYWFDGRGGASYRVSDHQVVSFQALGSKIFAVEGLAHLGVSKGSLIKLTHAGSRWQATTVAMLPHAPYAAATLDGKLLVVTSDALLEVADDGRHEVVVKDAPWGHLFPNSVALAADSKTLYIGMRQFVAAVSLADGTLRMLVPDPGFLAR